MERITVKHLNALVARINRELGMPVEPWTPRDAEGKIHANIGNYHLDGAYGGWALEQMVSDGGATRRVIDRGTARELYNAMFAFIAGYDAKARQS